MSIEHGWLYVNGEQKELIGSLSICGRCAKYPNCSAIKDNVELTTIMKGMKVKIDFWELMKGCQIITCPINEFEYSPFTNKGEN